MRKRLAILLCLLALASWATAELPYQAVSATTTSQQVNTPGASTATIKNDGAGTIYVKVFDAMEPPEVATSADGEIKSGEVLEISRSKGISALSILSASTSTVRVWWD